MHPGRFFQTTLAIVSVPAISFAAEDSSTLDRINALECQIEMQQRQIDAQRLQLDAALAY